MQDDKNSSVNKDNDALRTGADQESMTGIADLVQKIQDSKTGESSEEIIPDLEQEEAGILDRPTYTEPRKQQKKTLPKKNKPTPQPAPQPKDGEQSEVQQKQETKVPEQTIPQAPPRSPVRSYYEDMQKVMRTGKGGTMASALQSARDEKALKENKLFGSKKNLTFFGLGVLFLVIGVAILGYFLSGTFAKPINEEVSAPLLPSLVRADNQAGIDITGATSFKIETLAQRTIQEQTNEFQTITNLYFKENSLRGPVLVKRKNVFDALQIELPRSLDQALSDDFMYGIYTLNNTYPFLVFHVTSFDRAFSGMAEWEKTMLDDLKGIFPINEELLSPEAFNKSFTEELLKNKNIKILSLVPITKETSVVTIEKKYMLSDAAYESSHDCTDNVCFSRAITTCEPSVFSQLFPEGELFSYTLHLNEEAGCEITVSQSSDEGPENPNIMYCVFEEGALIPPNLLMNSDNCDGVLKDKIEQEKIRYQEVTVEVRGDPVPTLMYTFLDEKTLIITTNEDVITEINSRLADKQIFE